MSDYATIRNPFDGFTPTSKGLLLLGEKIFPVIYKTDGELEDYESSCTNGFNLCLRINNEEVWVYSIDFEFIASTDYDGQCLSSYTDLERWVSKIIISYDPSCYRDFEYFFDILCELLLERARKKGFEWGGHFDIYLSDSDFWECDEISTKIDREKLGISPLETKII